MAEHGSVEWCLGVFRSVSLPATTAGRPALLAGAALVALAVTADGTGSSAMLGAAMVRQASAVVASRARTKDEARMVRGIRFMVAGPKKEE